MFQETSKTFYLKKYYFVQIFRPMRGRARRRSFVEGRFPRRQDRRVDGGGLQGGGDHVQGDHQRHPPDAAALHRGDAAEGGETAEEDREGEGAQEAVCDVINYMFKRRDEKHKI